MHHLKLPFVSMNSSANNYTILFPNHINININIPIRMDRDFQAALYDSYRTAFTDNAGRILNAAVNNYSYKNYRNANGNGNANRNNNGNYSIRNHTNVRHTNTVNRLASEGILPVNKNITKSSNSRTETNEISANSGASPRASNIILAKPAASIVQGNSRIKPASHQAVTNKSTKYKSSFPNTSNRIRIELSVESGNLWEILTAQAGRAKFHQLKNELRVEGTDAHSLFITRYTNSIYNNIIHSDNFTVTTQCKCVGALYILLHLNMDDNSYIAVCCNSANKRWSIEYKTSQSKFSTQLAIAEDATLTSSSFYSLKIRFNSYKISLIVDGHTFFNEIACPNINTNNKSIGVGVIRSKASIMNWKVFVGDNINSDNNHSNNHPTAPNTTSASGISEQTLKVFGSSNNNNNNPSNPSQSSPFEQKNIDQSDVASDGSTSIASAPIPFIRTPYNGPEDRELIELVESSIINRCTGVTLDDIASLHEAKETLKEAVLTPLLLPEFFVNIRSPTRGILLHGPSGTGKTLLARAIASVSEVTFFNVNSSILTSKWRGQSEKLVTCLFNMARFYSPALIFIDEIDSLFLERGTHSEHEASRAFKAVMLSQMDGLYSYSNDASQQPCRIMVIGTTNTPWDLDPAIRRRLEKRIYIPLPDARARKEMFALHCRSIKLSTNVNFDLLAQMTANYSGSDLHQISREAALIPFRKIIANKSPAEIKALQNSPALQYEVQQENFVDAINKIQPTVSVKDLHKYEEWQKEFGSI